MKTDFGKIILLLLLLSCSKKNDPVPTINGCIYAYKGTQKIVVGCDTYNHFINRGTDMGLTNWTWVESKDCKCN